MGLVATGHYGLGNDYNSLHLIDLGENGNRLVEHNLVQLYRQSTGYIKRDVVGVPGHTVTLQLRLGGTYIKHPGLISTDLVNIQ